MFGYYVIQISDGGYALAGITNSPVPAEDVWLIKTDSMEINCGIKLRRSPG